VERLAAVWLPALARESRDGVTSQQFVDCLDEIIGFCPFAEPLRWGLIMMPIRGPSRFFGGEIPALEMLRAAVERSAQTPVFLGVAQGAFSAEAAALGELVIPPDACDEFRRSLPIETLGQRQLATTARRLGLNTVGAFGDLPVARVAERFDREVLFLHRVARGDAGELPRQRDQRLPARLRELRGDADPVVVQKGFFGEQSAADERAAAAAHHVRRRLGAEGVVMGWLHDGHTPLERGHLLPWGAPSPPRVSASAPWPGRLPSPSPTVTLAQPVRAELVDGAHRGIRIESSGLLNGVVAWCRLDGNSYLAVERTAGPWPLVTHWWRGQSARAHLQVLVEGGGAFLFVAERNRWWVAGVYD